MGKDGAEGDLPGRGVGGFRNAELRPGGRDGRRLAHLICGCLGVLGQSCGEVSLALVSHWGFDPFYWENELGTIESNVNPQLKRAFQLKWDTFMFIR